MDQAAACDFFITANTSAMASNSHRKSANRFATHEIARIFIPMCRATIASPPSTCLQRLLPLHEMLDLRRSCISLDRQPNIHTLMHVYVQASRLRGADFAILLRISVRHVGKAWTEPIVIRTNSYGTAHCTVCV